MTERTSREAQRDRVLEAALMHVPFDGWSRRTLSNAAADAGVDPGLARRLFPRGGDDLLAHFERWADRQMLARCPPDALATMRVHERIRALVRARLEVMTPHREAIRRAMAARLLPTLGLEATTATWRTLDTIWRAAGDQSRDYNYYTKRATLGAVWTATFLYWLEDHSPDLEATFAFLDRRLADTMQITKVRTRFEDAAKGLSRFLPLPTRS
jgi:ubiquinone biosynthesis protein COQ9